jgi:hypothetical protein
MALVLPAAAEGESPETPTPEAPPVSDETAPPEEPTAAPTEEPTPVPDEATPTPAPEEPETEVAVVLASSVDEPQDPPAALRVKKNVETDFVRLWRWEITKSADASSLKLKQGEQDSVTYTVNVHGTPVDSGWTMSGQIGILNPSNETATVESVVDSADGIAASVACQVGGSAVGFPFSLPAGWSAVCTFHASLPDGNPRTNVAVVNTSGPVPGGSASAAVTFGSPSSETDECIDVSDSLAGSLGTVCSGDGSFTYSQTVGPYQACGDYRVENKAAFQTQDSGSSGQAHWSVSVKVPCEPVCPPKDKPDHGKKGHASFFGSRGYGDHDDNDDCKPDHDGHGHPGGGNGKPNQGHECYGNTRLSFGRGWFD